MFLIHHRLNAMADNVKVDADHLNASQCQIRHQR